MPVFCSLSIRVTPAFSLKKGASAPSGAILAMRDLPQGGTVAKKTIEIQEAGSGTKSGFWEEVKAVLAPGDETEPKPATKLLEEDHARVRDLFDRYEDTRDRATKKRIVDEITRELTLHARVEEEIFYPRFLKSRGDPQKMVRESFEEHKVVKTLLTELGGMRPSHEQFDAKVTVLKENVLHHAKEEERDLFPEAESRLSKRQLQDMGAEIEDRKEELQRTFEGSRSRRRPSRARSTRRAGSKRAAHAPARPRSRVSKRR
jgi:hemerythrin superfamily protein